MEFFKKRNTQEQKEEIIEAPKAAVPESGQLAEARGRAEEQLKAIEKRIASERELFLKKIKDKEEEGITLKARLDSLISSAEQEKLKRESELKIMQENIQDSLAQLNSELQSGAAEWNEMISAKDKELDEAKHRAVFAETQKKLESEQALRKLQADLAQAENKLKSMERQLLEEQNQWVARLKAKEGDILGIKTQISLKDAQSRLEEEQSRKVKGDLEAAWQEQQDELKNRLEGQHRELAGAYSEKEAELIAFKSALEQKISRFKIESEKKEKEIESLRLSAQNRIKTLEKGIAEEQSRWQLVISEKDEQLRALKAELMLRESQEKAEGEKKIQEFREAENAANRRLKDIRQKISQEKENWSREIASKDEELKLIKIQSEIKLREMRETLEKRKAGSEQEKAGLVAELSSLESKLREEKLSMQKQMEIKTAEFADYQKEWQAKQSGLLKAEEQAIADCKKRKESLDKELADTQAALEQEKAHWSGVISQKEKEVSVCKGEISAREALVRRDLAALDAELKEQQQPVLRQLDEIKQKLKEFSRSSQEEMLRRETQKNTLAEQHKRQ
ncbi:MAG: hypothetical protein A2204_06065, partial [Elusimicrobia bacterium RIFOXYA1_FULL_47_7]